MCFCVARQRDFQPAFQNPSVSTCAPVDLNQFKISRQFIIAFVSFYLLRGAFGIGMTE